MIYILANPWSSTSSWFSNLQQDSLTLLYFQIALGFLKSSYLMTCHFVHLCFWVKHHSVVLRQRLCLSPYCHLKSYINPKQREGAPQTAAVHSNNSSTLLTLLIWKIKPCSATIPRLYYCIILLMWSNSPLSSNQWGLACLEGRCYLKMRFCTSHIIEHTYKVNSCYCNKCIYTLYTVGHLNESKEM